MKKWIYLLAILGALVIIVVVGFLFVRYNRLMQVAATLPREEALAQQAGMPLDPAQLQTPLPPPALNAAPDYERLMAILKSKPISPGVDEAIANVGTRNATAADYAAAGKLLAGRQDVMALIDRATSKPDCDFNRNWSLGPSLMFPEYRWMREAARLLRAKSILLAKQGHFRRAILTQARGFRLAQHATSDPVIIGYLVGLGLDAISLQGMEKILRIAGLNAAVDDLIQKTLAADQPRFSLRHGLKGESVMDTIICDMVQNGKMGLNELAGSEGSRNNNHRGGSFLSRLIAEAGLAIVLREQLLYFKASTLSYPERSIVMGRLDKAIEAKVHTASKTINPAWILPAIMMPSYGGAAESEQQVIARCNVLEAAAEVLAYRARYGAFPKQLSAAGVTLTDPYNGKALQYHLHTKRFIYKVVRIKGAGMMPKVKLKNVRVGKGFAVYSVGRTGRHIGVPFHQRPKWVASFDYRPVK
ncbi:MAG: hypothetical protein M1330_05320 [Armatimonadetes bacterium]|nr:hypothetical protein [Armatimonadota bacterium]